MRLQLAALGAACTLACAPVVACAQVVPTIDAWTGVFGLDSFTGKRCVIGSTSSCLMPTSGGGGGGGSNAAAGLTGSAVPTAASYNGLNIGGSLTGWTGLHVGSAYAGQVDLTSLGGVALTNSMPVSQFGTWSFSCSSGCGGSGGPVTATSGAYALGSIVDLGTGASPAAYTTNSYLTKLQAANGNPTDAGCIATDATSEGEVCLLKGAILKLNAIIAALGTPLQAGGAVTVTGGPSSTTQGQQLTAEQAIQAATKVPSSFGAVTVGTPFTTGLGVAAVCTVAGNVQLDASDTSTITVPVNAGYNQFGFAVTKVDSASTATCTYTVLR